MPVSTAFVIALTLFAVIIAVSLAISFIRSNIAHRKPEGCGKCLECAAEGRMGKNPPAPYSV